MDIPNMASNQIFTKKDLPFFIGKYYHNNFEDLRTHTHDFIEIAYVYDGKGYHIYDDATYSVAKGDLYIINSRTPHCFYPTNKDNSEHLVVYNLCFLPEFIDTINIRMSILTELTDIMLYKSLYEDKIIYAPDLKLSSSMRTEIEQLYEKMYMEFTSEEFNYMDILRLSLCELLLKIHRFYKINNTMSTNQHFRYRRQIISDCIQYLQENYSQKITIEQLSNNFFLSKSYLSSLFRQATGSSVVEYLQHIRINKACELLTETDFSITEISTAVGYSDYRFFNKSFEKITGYTAQQFRKKAKSDVI